MFHQYVSDQNIDGQKSFGFRLLVLISIIVFFEGSVGKWIDASLVVFLVLIRDFSALLFIYWATKRLDASNFKVLPEIFLLISLCLLIWVSFQFVINQAPLPVPLLGLRYWLLYQWVGLMAALALSKKDIINLARLLLIMLVVSTPLAISQHLLPPSHFINSQIDTDEVDIFVVVSGIVRTTGFFSFTTGYALFISMCIPLILNNSILGEKIIKNKWNYIFAFSCLCISSFVSGSRTVVVSFAIYISIFIAIRLSFKNNQSSNLALPLFLLVVSAILLPVVLPDAFSSILSRFATANDDEDFLGRILSSLFGEPYLFEHYTFLGRTIGAGNNAASVYLIGAREFMLGETEASKVLMEAGAFGLLWILFKLIFIGWGLLNSIRFATKYHDTSPFMYWIVCSVALMTWPIIGQLSVNSFACFVIFFAVSSIRRNKLEVKN